MKQLTVLGSTGSVGVNVLNIVRHLGEKQIKVVALAANSNIDLLYEQALEFHPQMIGVYDKKKALELQKKLPNTKVIGGAEGIEEVASLAEANVVFNAIVGMCALEPMMAAIKQGKNIALANKEVLVSAGEIIMQAAKKHHCQIIPVDSEHNALFQCLQNQSIDVVERLILTASGGPFLNYTEQDLLGVSVEQALKHPNWQMGSKITIDCSTMMNKGFEVIEAHWLFDVPVKQIEVVIHPQSIVHSMVEFIDNTIIAQMGEPDMRTPIQHALTYPEKLPGSLKPFDFTKCHQLQFLTPDMKKFSCLRLAYEALYSGGSLPCYLNAANETLVSRFLKRKISWMDISRKLETLMQKHRKASNMTIEEIIHIDQTARMEASQV